MTSGLHNAEYYRGTFLKIQKYMEVREEGMETEMEKKKTKFSRTETKSEHDEQVCNLLPYTISLIKEISLRMLVFYCHKTTFFRTSFYILYKLYICNLF